MNTQKRILVGTVLLMVTSAAWLRLKSTPVSSDRKQPVESVENTSRSSASKAKSPASASHGAGGQTNVVVSQSPQAMGLAEKTKAWSDHRTVPINFWGKVVDQFDQPVPGVRVVLAVRDWRGLVDMGDASFRRHQIQTDGLGNFNLLGEMGDSLSISALEKEGYALMPGTRLSFGYNGPSPTYQPVAGAPFIFRVWKKGQPEPLIFKRAYSRLPSDGTPLTVDLVTGLSSTNTSFAGDITIRMIRTPQNIEKVRRYDWDVSIQANSGGIQLATDAAMYLAPESGYQSSVELKVQADQEKWVNSTNLTVFLNHRQGRLYTRAVLKLSAHSLTGHSPFGFEAFINPAGSRNLEDDPRLRVEPILQTAGAPGQDASNTVSAFAQPRHGQASIPFAPQLPPGFQALTNRPGPFTPPVPPRPQ
jgi:hypothetical protein